MRHKKESLSRLFKKIITGKATSNQQELADRWFEQLDLSNKINVNRQDEKLLSECMQENIQKHFFSTQIPKQKAIRLWVRIVLTILFVGILFICIYWSYTSKNPILFFSVFFDPLKVKRKSSPDRIITSFNTLSSQLLGSGLKKQNSKDFIKREAFFDVKKDNRRPSFISINCIQAKVIGTFLNTKQYLVDSQAKPGIKLEQLTILEKKTLSNKTNLVNAKIVSYTIVSKIMVLKNANNYALCTWIYRIFAVHIVFSKIGILRALDRSTTLTRHNQRITRNKIVVASFLITTWTEFFKIIFFTNHLCFRQDKATTYIH